LIVRLGNIAGIVLFVVIVAVAEIVAQDLFIRVLEEFVYSREYYILKRARRSHTLFLVLPQPFCCRPLIEHDLFSVQDKLIL
jgi:hypothetical protein